MKMITVLSGKGGTGKSTITAILGEIFESTIIADCDVEASNQKFFHRPIETKEILFHGKSVAIRDEELCIKCRKCYEHCNFDAIDAKTLEIDGPTCEGCSFCEYVCPQKAITMQPFNNGMVYISKTNKKDFVHADLFPGQDNSGLLVAEVLKNARKIAEEKNYDYLLCDGPPGIACPVIASLNQSNYILAVTEPSESALHDLKRLEELKQFFKIDGGVIINKADTSELLNKKIKEYIEESSWEFIGEVKRTKEIRNLSMMENFEISEELKTDFSKFIDKIKKSLEEKK